MDWYSVLSDRAQRSGGESGVDTPVLIPNTEVKHSSGENSWACPCEDSTLPGLYRRSYDLLFLFPLFLPPSLFSSLSCIIASVTERMDDMNVLLGLSGGVDSAVAASLFPF